MADLAHFAYRAQLPDGSEVIRQGTAATPPTFGQLADFAANKGERFLGIAPMTPAPEAAPEPAPPAPAPEAPPAAPAPAPAPSTIGGELQRTFLPKRTLISEAPSILGGMAAGAVTAPFAPWGAIPAAGAGSMAGEGSQIVAEQVMGWPPAEEGTVPERLRRAYVRGATGEGVARLVTAGGRVVLQRTAGPLLNAAEKLEPVLTRELPETVQAVPTVGGDFRRIGRLLKNPAELAAADLTDEGREVLLARWWQQTTQGRSPQQVVAAWDGLAKIPGAQEALAGPHLEPVKTLIGSLRGTPETLLPRSLNEVTRYGSVPYVLREAGYPGLATGAGVASYGTAQAPRLLLRPGGMGFLAGLPRLGERVASPWAAPAVTRLGTQTGAAWLEPPIEREPPP